jgi:serine/threonine-protein kinase
MIGDIIGNYRIVRELGQGGMGAVYEGIDIMVERPVAIKMLKAELAGNPDVIERFRVEAVTLARLNHPCIATLYSFFREGENYYMVMEFVRGETLEDLIRRSGRLAAEYAADILAQTLDGMAHAHAMGVLHRDIKPANIMITGEGRVKVTDFGIARVLGSSRMTRDGRIIGTLEYLAPERIRGEEADVRSDLYSVGVVMYEAISGRLPFTADTDYDLMQAHLNQRRRPCGAWASRVRRGLLTSSIGPWPNLGTNVSSLPRNSAMLCRNMPRAGLLKPERLRRLTRSIRRPCAVRPTKPRQRLLKRRRRSDHSSVFH